MCTDHNDYADQPSELYGQVGLGIIHTESTMASTAGTSSTLQGASKAGMRINRNWCHYVHRAIPVKRTGPSH